ncbi:MAG: hypothetical protein LBJ47_00270 [Tannerella sp.]|jgi:hypothetical protein|nr:hypothetical protein [Tannerella sp.]
MKSGELTSCSGAFDCVGFQSKRPHPVILFFHPCFAGEEKGDDVRTRRRRLVARAGRLFVIDRHGLQVRASGNSGKWLTGMLITRSFVFRHCERSEAIQTVQWLDCFVPRNDGTYRAIQNSLQLLILNF